METTEFLNTLPNSVINSNIECPAVIMQTKTICSVHYLFFSWCYEWVYNGIDVHMVNDILLNLNVIYLSTIQG